MNRDDELTLRRWLEARDPGAARAALREAVASVPFTHQTARFPGLDLTLRSGFGLAPIARPLIIAIVVLLALAAIAGALVVQPWRPFPPPGLLAFTVPISVDGSSSIVIVGADGSARRVVGRAAANVYDHSPRWSGDGRTLLFARNSDLSASSSCAGVGSVVAYDLATATERVIATGLRPIYALDVSPSGRYAAFTYPPAGCGAQVELSTVDLETGAATATVIVPQDSESDPSQGVRWQVAWTGETATAVPESHITTANGRDYTTTIDVSSHDGRTVIRWAWTTPNPDPVLTVVQGSIGDSNDLGRGSVPSWSPDDRLVAHVEPGPPAGPDLIDYVRDRVVITDAATGVTRQVGDALWPDGVGSERLPSVSWTKDGGAIFWVDMMGAHVVDVVTGRAADLSALDQGCDDIQWQPLAQ